MKSWMEEIPDFYSKRGMCSPAVKNNVYFFVRVFAKQILKTFNNNKTIFPVVEPAMNFSSMDVYSCWHIQQPLNFLLCGILYFLLFCIGISAVLLYCYLSLLVKT